MKHILNNLTEEEKNAIREQHTGGMKVITENFSKLINSKLGDSKPLVAEQTKPTRGTQIQPIQIKIGEFLVNLTTMEKTGQGSKFYGQIRGDKEYQEVLFSCGRGKVQMKKLGDNTIKFIDSPISPEGLKLLNKAAGCDTYVKNQGTSSDMV
jgi:hypothetical protein